MHDLTAASQLGTSSVVYASVIRNVVSRWPQPRATCGSTLVMPDLFEGPRTVDLAGVVKTYDSLKLIM